MSKSTIALVTCALALSACSSGQKTPQAGQASGSPQAAAEAAATQIKLQPGEYETTSKVLEFSVSGVPQNQLDIMKNAMASNNAQSNRYCFTAADAAKGPKEMVSEMQRNDCKLADFSSTSSSVSGTMQCSFRGAAATSTKFDGTFTGDSSSVTMESDEQMPGMAGKTVHMKMRVDSHRVGECSG